MRKKGEKMNWDTYKNTQERVIKILTNSLKRDRLAHAYLFKGDKGTGKKGISLVFAKSFFCNEKVDMEPCGKCKDCKRIDSGNHPDVHVISPDGHSIKIDQIRRLQKEFAYLGVESRKKVYILEHAEKMTNQAANSLLKFLEEPGQHTLAILLTEQSQFLLDTIISRCQVITFQPISSQLLIDHLNKLDVPEYLSRSISVLTNDMTEGERLANDDWFVQARNKMIKLVEELKNRPHNIFLFVQTDWLDHFKERDQISMGLDLLLLWYKDIYLYQLDEKKLMVNIDQVEALSAQALQMSQTKVREKMQAILEAKRRLYTNMNQQLLMEQLVLQL
jgi:DNA polymerase-3 subunit delta'